ncbi:MAG: ATP-binding protein [Candidatus Gracilibacteria bacterium]|nr:ATP-binding protein [Candidatus Gracilibacteria bacterium]
MIDIINKSKNIINQKIFSRPYYLKKMNEMVNNKNILIISGQRRVGKSYIIIDYLKSNNIDLKEVFYLNKELDSLNQIKTNIELEKLFNEYDKENEVKYIIIDEIQDIEIWENFIRSKFSEKKYNIIITGSNSKLLSSELSTYLTGRYINLDVFPLTYFEFLNIKKLQNSKENFLYYLEFGGLPEIVLETNDDLKRNYIKNLKDSIILKDIVNRYKIKDYSFFEKILGFVSQNIGNITSLRKVEDYLKKDKIKVSLSTISNYIKYLENTYLINNCEKYDIAGKKVLEYNSKYYFNDLGIRNSIYYNFNFDIGKLLENYVFNILLSKGYKIYIGNKKGLEIDFIAQKSNDKKYFQVIYLISSEEVYNREFGNLKQIGDNFEKIVLSMDDVEFRDDSGIKHFKIWELEDVL